jgi:hypothetical protein
MSWLKDPEPREVVIYGKKEPKPLGNIQRNSTDLTAYSRENTM